MQGWQHGVSRRAVLQCVPLPTIVAVQTRQSDCQYSATLSEVPQRSLLQALPTALWKLIGESAHGRPSARACHWPVNLRRKSRHGIACREISCSMRNPVGLSLLFRQLTSRRSRERLRYKCQYRRCKPFGLHHATSIFRTLASFWPPFGLLLASFWPPFGCTSALPGLWLHGYSV